MRRWRLFLSFALAGGLLLPLTACKQPSKLQRIQERGELVVATRLDPTTYYRGADGPAGLEFDLISGFAEFIGVKARFVFPRDLQHLLRQVEHGEVHMAAAGLTVTRERKRRLRFSQPYQEVSEQLVYRRGSRKPHSLAEVAPGELQVIAGASHGDTLKRLQASEPSLAWKTRTGISMRRLLDAVNKGEVRYTVTDSNELAVARRIYRYLRPAFKLSDEKPLAWAFPLAGDDSLLKAANRYLTTIRYDNTLSNLIERYYGHSDRLDFVAKRDFQRHARERLPRLKPFFQLASRQTDIDWRLLAAIGYQESHWNAKAVSPTGVRGVMMLTADTAKQLGIENRRDPEQSILGGARYLRIVEEKLPERIPEPHRLWLTLAGYNVGFGHLEDARILTQREGGDPDRWQDVRKHLPLLNQKRYYRKLKHGFGNGVQAVEYVENIRSYYDLLVWFDNHPEDWESYSSSSQSAR
jgi:membrane-bound lytic murein transglycosylase F